MQVPIGRAVRHGSSIEQMLRTPLQLTDTYPGVTLDEVERAGSGRTRGRNFQHCR